MNAPLARVALLAAAAAAVTCTEFERTNPFDPGYPLMLTVTGPDTIRSLFDTFNIVVTTDPLWPDAPIELSFGERPSGMEPGNLLIQPLGGGTFRVVDFTDFPTAPVPIIATAGPHSTAHSIVLKQMLGRVTAQPCTPGVCTAFVDEPTAAISAVARDSNGYTLAWGTLPTDLLGTIENRTPTFATLTGVDKDGADMFVRFTPVSRGIARFAFTKYAPDSLVVYIDNRPDTVLLTCPATLSVGATAQLTARTVDSNGVDLLGQPAVTWSANGFQGRVTMSAAGVATGVTAGTERVFAEERLTFKRGSCDISVEP